jgi:hypothetical protein
LEEERERIMQQEREERERVATAKKAANSKFPKY